MSACSTRLEAHLALLMPSSRKSQVGFEVRLEHEKEGRDAPYSHGGVVLPLLPNGSRANRLLRAYPWYPRVNSLGPLPSPRHGHGQYL